LLTTLLLLVSAEDVPETDQERYERYHATPKPDLAVAFFAKPNHKEAYKRTKLLENDSSDHELHFSTGEFQAKNLFQLVVDKDAGHDNRWFIYTSDRKYRLWCAWNGRLYKTLATEPFREESQFMFDGPDEDGYYEIVVTGAARKGYKLANFSPTEGGCLPPPRWCEKDQTCEHDGHNEVFGKFDGDCDWHEDCWGNMLCSRLCKYVNDNWGKDSSFDDNNSDCCVEVNGHANEINTKWRLETSFRSEADWSMVKSFNNDYSTPASETYTQTMGYTASFEKSNAKKKGVTKTLEMGAEGAFKKLDLSMDVSKSVTNEYSQAVTAALSGTFTVKDELNIVVEPYDCIKIWQVTCKQDDVPADTMGMMFYTKDTWVRACDKGPPEGDDVRSIEDLMPMEEYMRRHPLSSAQSVSTQSTSVRGKGKVHTLDQEYHMTEESTDALMDKEENWSKKEHIKYQEAVAVAAESQPLAVTFFAAVGLAFTAVGAFKYYTGAEHKDFVSLK